MDNFKYLIVNKNRGWRGLAEAIILDREHKQQLKMVFSFSQHVWKDLIVLHQLVLQDTDYYYVIHFEDRCDRLPKPTQQRSVLIKNFATDITQVNRYAKTEWSSAPEYDGRAIQNFKKNNNNHTTSDWNYIGVRVIPTI